MLALRPAGTPLEFQRLHGMGVLLFDEARRALDTASARQADWDATPASERAACLERAADLLEERRDLLLGLLVREAGKTLGDALAEIREAADFCRYYAAEGRRLFGAPTPLPGPTGERNELSLHGRGAIACISPWNFPLAIFTGQVAAALAAGNTVVAKPAEATPLVALEATRALHDAGIPVDALHTLPMAGREFGEAALAHPRLAGVIFTGSTATAQWLNRRLAAREGAILPLVAETGGINAMIVGSSALAEQVVDDALASTFGSAGQRCSALRLLCVQEDAAARSLREHLEDITRHGRILESGTLGPAQAQGSFFPPTLVELDDPRQLTREAFGPILHVLRFRSRELPQLLAAIRESGYGLTLGIQTRLASTEAEVFAGSLAGNVYVNRSMTGAVVGVQPFGGSGLSGTGPKAGGPHYLVRLATERTLTVNTTATGGNTELLGLG